LICDGCGKRFVSKIYLARHISSKHLTSQEQQCDICQKRFRNRKGLRTHRKCHFEENYKHQCTLCDRRYLNKKELDNHFRMKHTKERPLKCNECGAGFLDRNSLQNHIRRHLGINDSVCKFCFKKFLNKSSLYVHLLGPHKHQVKTYRCDQCPKKLFLFEQSLISHKLRFHGDGNFSIGAAKQNVQKSKKSKQTKKKKAPGIKGKDPEIKPNYT
jgi:KRAB domain-containing zinc finger protein